MPCSLENRSRDAMSHVGRILMSDNSNSLVTTFNEQNMKLDERYHGRKGRGTPSTALSPEANGRFFHELTSYL